MEKKSTKIVAEIGCNHKGKFAIAEKLIEVAKMCGAHVAKFQKRNNKELLDMNEYEKPHPEPWNAYGSTYGIHREAQEFSKEQHKKLMGICAAKRITYSTSVWDVSSAFEITELNPEFIKIPSAMNLNFEMQEYLCENFKGKIHISIGMTNDFEKKEIIEFYEERSRINDLVVYCCTSGYPVNFDEICLLEIKRLQTLLKGTKAEVGFSGHHLGIAPDIAALTLGVNWVERHFTLDRTWKGTDHAASLEPEGLRRLCRDIKNVEKSLTYKTSEVLPIEDIQRKKLKKFT